MKPATRPDDDASGAPAPAGPGGVAFLLTQLGTHAAIRFGERVADLGLTPPLTGLMRAIAADPGSSQQQLATRLGLLPSRVVSFVDDLEQRGLVQRERSSDDRRQYRLRLTKDGRAMLRRVGRLARSHEADLTGCLEGNERTQLAGMLARIADQQGLTPGVHPGYRQIGRS